MKYLDCTLPTPAENLALDEALALQCDQGGPEVLRFWEPVEIFVVAGFSNQVEREVNLSACEAAHIPVFRRISGGGTVLQGPGCLNYALVLRCDSHPDLLSVTGANRHIMARNARALSRLTGREVTVCGHTDLAIGDRKISGNAQRRLKNSLLFHGVLLLGLDLSLLARCLKFPSRPPDYRAGRSHESFVHNLGLPAPAVKNALRAEWGVLASPPPVPLATVTGLCRQKYNRPEWNQRGPWGG